MPIRRSSPPEDLRVLLFQATRELLFNVIKHAKVRKATVQMEQVAEDKARVVVADEGVGFHAASCCQPKPGGSGFGLFNIHERLEMVGGRVEVDTAPGCGTRMTLVAPLRSSPAG